MTTKQTEESPLYRVLRSLVPNWDIALTLGSSLTSYFLGQRSVGMYEVLDYDSTLEILDARGRLAVSRRKQTVRFLQDNVIAYQDHVWGDGDILADYKCSPGVEVDRYRDGNRWNLLISLRETKSKGDTQDIYIERTIRNGFTQPHEWIQTDVWCKTHRLRLAVIFPARRPCRRALLVTRSQNRTEVLSHEHFHHQPDGRQMIVWEKKNPRQAEVFTLRWEW